MAAPLNILESVPTAADSIAVEQPPTESEMSESIAGAGILGQDAGGTTSGIEDPLSVTEAAQSDLPESVTNTADSAEAEVPPIQADEGVDVATAGHVERLEATTVEEEEGLREDLSTSVTTAAGSTATVPQPVPSDELVNIDNKTFAEGLRDINVLYLPDVPVRPQFLERVRTVQR
jgi:hypothetical protein